MKRTLFWLLSLWIVCALMCVAHAETDNDSWENVLQHLEHLQNYTDASNAAAHIAQCGRHAPLAVRRRMAHTLLDSVSPAGQGAGETYAAAVLADQLLGADAEPAECATIALTQARALLWHGLTLEARQLVERLSAHEIPCSVSGLWWCAEGLCLFQEERFDKAERMLARACAGGVPAWEEALLARARLAVRDGRYEEAFTMAEQAARRWGMGCACIQNNQALHLCFSLATAPPAPRIVRLWQLLDDLRASMPRTASYEDALVFLHIQDRFLRRLYPEALGHIQEAVLP